jgi:hypothetical protein
MNRTVLMGLLLSLLGAASASAQVVVPQAPSSSSSSSSSTPSSALSAQVGVERFGPPVLTLAFAPASRPLSTSHAGLLLVARLDTAGRSVGVGGGVQATQVFADEWFVREAAVAAPFLVAVDDVAGGVRAEATVQLGKRFGDTVDVVVGPRATGVLTVAGSSDGRVGLEGAAALRWRVVEQLALTGEVSAGSDFGHRGGAFSGSVLSGAAFVGVQWSP